MKKQYFIFLSCIAFLLVGIIIISILGLIKFGQWQFFSPVVGISTSKRPIVTEFVCSVILFVFSLCAFVFALVILTKSVKTRKEPLSEEKIVIPIIENIRISLKNHKEKRKHYKLEKMKAEITKLEGTDKDGD